MLNRRNISNKLNNTNNEESRNKLMVVPYINGITDMVTSSIKKTNKNSKFIVGYRCLHKLNKIIKTHKAPNQLVHNSNVIYQINCRDCNASYVGQTKRQLKTKVKEHRNNIKLDSKNHTVISEHIITKNHSFDWDKVKILDHETNYFKRLVSEMIHIKEQKNSLNLMKDTELLSMSYSDLLDKLATFK